MQALVGGAVDYAATSFDVALQAFANGADIRRFATTGRLPLFALAVAPGQVDAIATLNDLEGKAVGVSALGNADHTMLLYLLAEAGADAQAVDFAVLGPNLFEALRRGQVAAGMVQEPALTLIVEDGGKVLFNAMDIADSTRLLGGAYEFMGVAYRAEEREQRLQQMQKLARALERGLRRAAQRPDPGDPRVAAGRASGRRRRRALRRDHRPLPRLALSRSWWRSTSRPAGGWSTRWRSAACSSPASTSTRCSTPRSCRREGSGAAARGRTAARAPPARRPPQPPRRPGAPVVRVRDLRMRYGDAEAVVEGVSLDVAEGQVVSLIGPSGSGKSTVLRAIAALHAPDGGTVELFVDRRETGFLFQDDALLPWRTARQNVALGLRLRGLAQAEALREADGWLARLGLAGLEGRYPRQLSGGQRKRVALAQVLALRPRLLLMDEPFASLDAIVRHHVTQDLLELGRARAHRRAARDARPRGGAGAVGRRLPALARARGRASATAIRSISRGRAT